MDSGKQYTLKEIAEMAGVSRATVDRVIHVRGKVSDKAYQRVKEILDSINYQPNFIAQSLKKGAKYKIAALLPDYDFDIYWEKALQGVKKTLKDLSILGLFCDNYLFNPNETASFVFNSRQVIEGDYDGVLVAPFFYNESLEFMRKCENIGLPYITFNTFIEAANPLCHIGQNLVQSGKTAASLLDKLLNKENKVLLLHIDEDIVNSRHMQEKEEGFKNYFKGAGYEEGKVVVLKVSKTTEIEKALLTALKSNSAIKGIFVSTSKVYYVADLKEAYQLDHKLIGYDLITKNINHLKKGNIDFLIYQNPEAQASQGISLLADYLMFHKDIPGQQLLPIEIVIKENHTNYL